MALTLAGLEIEKTSGYWRAKGFKQLAFLSVWNVKMGISSTSGVNGVCTIQKQEN